MFLEACIYSAYGCQYLTLKGTLMQIWKSAYMFLFIQKYYTENFAFLILRLLELHTRKVCKIFVYKHTETINTLKNRLILKENAKFMVE